MLQWWWDEMNAFNLIKQSVHFKMMLISINLLASAADAPQRVS